MGVSAVNFLAVSQAADGCSNPMFDISFNCFHHADAQHRIEVLGGADRDRTGGLLVANQALSQLSYSPIKATRLPLACRPGNGELAAALSGGPG
jgi:hypothetical protein